MGGIHSRGRFRPDGIRPAPEHPREYRCFTVVVTGCRQGSPGRCRIWKIQRIRSRQDRPRPGRGRRSDDYDPVDRATAVSDLEEGSAEQRDRGSGRGNHRRKDEEGLCPMGRELLSGGAGERYRRKGCQPVEFGRYELCRRLSLCEFAHGGENGH